MAHGFTTETNPEMSHDLRKDRKAVENTETDVYDLIYKNFYVDDGVVSCRTSEEAINLLARTQRVLHDNGKLRLHKFASNNREVLDSFPQSELAKDLCNLDLCNDALPMQRSVGLSWDIETDQFTFRTCKETIHCLVQPP